MGSTTKHCDTQFVGMMSETIDSEKRHESDDGKNGDRRNTAILRGKDNVQWFTAPEWDHVADIGNLGPQYQPARTE